MQTMPVAATDAIRCSFNDHARLYDAMLEHRNSLVRVAYSILHHTEDAEDAVQAAYLSAWAGWSGFQGQSSVKTWLTTIVMNKSFTELQRRRRRTWVSVDEDPALMVEAEWQLALGQTTPEQHAMRAQSAFHVRQQLAHLPQRTKGFVMLRYLQDMTVEEIASSHGSTRGAVKGHLRRGCQAMRKGMQRSVPALAM